MELILYYIIESKWLLISFLILMFILGTIAYIAMRNFNQEKKIKIVFYGLFLRMTDIDILKLSVVIVKSFLAVFTVIAIGNEAMMWICVSMICILTLIYIITEFKRTIYELVCTIMQLIMIYSVYVVNNYMSEVEYTSFTLIIKACLTVFILILTAYMFFRDIDIISEDRSNKNFEKAKKNEKLEKGMK